MRFNIMSIMCFKIFGPELQWFILQIEIILIEQVQKHTKVTAKIIQNIHPP